MILCSEVIRKKRTVKSTKLEQDVQMGTNALTTMESGTKHYLRTKTAAMYAAWMEAKGIRIQADIAKDQKEVMSSLTSQERWTHTLSKNFHEDKMDKLPEFQNKE